VLIRKVIDKWIYHMPKRTMWTYFPVVQELFWEYSDYIQKLCKDAVLNKKLITKLRESRFDLILSDPIGPCGELLAEILKIPLVYSLRFTPGHNIENH
ncbi:hypothetical protein HPG69_001441, partial [Diceros bicornis minor]